MSRAMLSGPQLSSLYQAAGSSLGAKDTIKARVLLDSTVDGKTPKVFHNKCDGIPDTFVVVSLKDAGGRTVALIGGYTTVPWSSSAGGTQDGKAFVFAFKGPRSSQLSQGGLNGQFNPSIRHNPAHCFAFWGGQNFHDLTFDGTTLHLQPGHSTAFQPVIHSEVGAKGISWSQFDFQVLTLSKAPLLLDSPYCGGADPFATPAADHLQAIAALSPPAPLSRANVLLFGPVGSGKSSIVSTLDSAVKGRVSHVAPYGTSGIPGVPFTRRLVKYKFATEPGNSASLLPISLWDTMGWDSASYQGGELEQIVDGHLPSGFDLSRTPYHSQPGYSSQPGLPDQAHAVAFVLDAADVGSEDKTRELRRFLAIARGRGVPAFLFLTKVDRFEPMLLQPAEAGADAEAEGLSKTFLLPSVAELVRDAAAKSGLPPNMVFPIKSYEFEVETAPEPQILLLRALRTVLESVIDSQLQNTSLDESDSQSGAGSGTESKGPGRAPFGLDFDPWILVLTRLMALGLDPESSEIGGRAWEAYRLGTFDLPRALDSLDKALLTPALKALDPETRTDTIKRALERCLKPAMEAAGQIPGTATGKSTVQVARTPFTAFTPIAALGLSPMPGPKGSNGASVRTPAGPLGSGSSPREETDELEYYSVAG